MIGALIAGGFLAGEYIYHRWFQDQPPPPNPGKSIQLPTSSEGASVPIIYGKVRVRAPILAWWGNAQATPGADVGSGSASPFIYGIDMFYVIGIPFDKGIATMTAMWTGERLLGGSPYVKTGAGGHETPIVTDTSVLDGDAGFVGGEVEVLNGNADQELVDGSLVSLTYTADRMILNSLPPNNIPGYRGYLSACLFNGSETAWYIGANPQPDSMSFEAATYPQPLNVGFGLIPYDLTQKTTIGPSNKIGDDCNPIDVILDILLGGMGKLGMDVTRIDQVSFLNAAQTLDDEAHGFSRSWEDSSSAKDRIEEVLRQIDGVIFEDFVDNPEGYNQSGIKIKLIRPDYDVRSLMTISPANCTSLENFAASGWTGVANKVRLTFTERANQYRDGSALSFNQANAVGQDGEVAEIVLQMPGITDQDTANQVCARELGARSRPLMKCRAIVSREFYRQTPGNAILVNWPEANISYAVFRIANVSRGTLENGLIALDLIQDWFYQWRHAHAISPVPHPSPGPKTLLI